jgi:glycosyltransferase involved in cell wall biosynthesis
MRQGFIVPVYNHGKTALPLAKELSSKGLPIILVDDGSNDETKSYLKEALTLPGVALVSLEKNSGKGEAVLQGIKKAREMGLSHVLQIDADGQHDLGQVDFFLEQSKINPEKIICAYPEFDDSAPRGRVIGRKISNFWAAVTTCSKKLIDVMCGFRVYPVEPFMRITQKYHTDKRMGFDAEILIRLYWEGVDPVFLPIKVVYPEDGISNFRMFRDNVRISWMFTRLFGGMLIRLPQLIKRNRKNGSS